MCEGVPDTTTGEQGRPQALEGKRGTAGKSPPTWESTVLRRGLWGTLTAITPDNSLGSLNVICLPTSMERQAVQCRDAIALGPGEVREDLLSPDPAAGALSLEAARFCQHNRSLSFSPAFLS